ncbi:c-type cytochrome biogenesis protein CcmI [Seohaeicola saemankumensis]|nr:c-type cytochrome biogenesis protein CcmI [Seohaeicola saemankumensis]MCA0871403.1 c-type cytochrome biogenesis protein CcmI [Seohaeicola saemankumensis]
MIIFWMALLSLTAIGFLLWPLASRQSSTAPVVVDQATPAVLLDQLDEVARDLDRSLISAEEANAARVEIKRRILAAARRAGPAARVASDSGRSALFVAAIFVPALAALYYLQMGAPEISSLAYADRQEERAEQERISDLTNRLYARLTSEPDGGVSEGWMLLGQTYYRMQEFEKAVTAFEVVAERPDATSTTFSMLAEAQIGADNGIVTPRSEAAINKAFELDPRNPAAVFYRALAMEQRGEEGEAHDLLVAFLGDAESFAPWMEPFVAKANRIGQQLGRNPVSLTEFAPMASNPGPNAADVAAAGEMSEQDRSEFIRSMVDRLAARLEDEPDDLDGWLRLANAYRVLGETEKARDALETAVPLLDGLDPNDPRRMQAQSAFADLTE